MHKQAIFAAGLLTISVTACGSAEKPEVVEQIVVREPGSAEVVAPEAPTPSAGALDLVALGEDAFQTCTGCHSVAPDGRSAAGPNLYGVIGRKAGSLAGYSYSDAFAASEVVWDEASLDGFLADPTGYIPGSEMMAGAVPDEQAREAIIAYLSAQSDNASGQ
ncbi:c-type cytochrome [Erythrobacter sp. SCSIO 43205]|uniref:c-type cytochrome n=1 Tax=Erythrobacter sp. SCSIO 43205 TaxID=2779361 RepID=UPI001CA7D020|nr:c-type cytochrome [Erythrobacter sp. SCSIO 43205]UAB78032.1 c-type cytochrome [Erythrobacter sp. SCSIO 43205]